MNKSIQVLILILFALLPVSSALGKIADPRPLIHGNVRYESHRHTVWATDIGTKKVLWETRISMSYYRGEVDPRREKDVQWNIISSLRIEGNILVIKNSIGETFKLDFVTGKLLKKRQKKVSHTNQPTRLPRKSPGDRKPRPHPIPGFQ